ncbi:MAG: EamA family transporter, partial [Oscillospiraceae bacterium]|nr:EamA family transporter [Oscillospiraceae bacterium]
VVFYRLFFSAIVSFIMLKILGINMQASARQIAEMVVMGIIGFGATMALLTISYSLIPTGLATMLHFTYPLFVTVTMTMVFKEKITVFKTIACLCALGGIVLMSDFSSLSVVGILLAIGSGITYASYVIASKKLKFASLHGLVIVFYVSCFACVFFGIKAMITKEMMLPPTPLALGLVLTIAVFCTVMSLFLLTYGIKTLGASTASVLNMLEPVTSFAAGMIIYKEAIALKGIAGCVLVILAGIAVAFDSATTKNSR